MRVNGRHYRTIWLEPRKKETIFSIDQTRLPHAFVIEELKTSADIESVIKNMHIRGAIVIGAAAAYGMYLATLEAPANEHFDAYVLEAANRLKATRPTAVNLAWAVERQWEKISRGTTIDEKISLALSTAMAVAAREEEACRKIGEYGLEIVKQIGGEKPGKTVNILTHCNAGWLACVDHGTATAPIYAAHDAGLKVHVWVDETRPWNQGARLTAWELGQHQVPHTVIADNTGGHLMQHGMVDLVMVGADRVTRTGDVANKIGTYLKALAAQDNAVPFYVAFPSSTFDWNLRDGVAEIPIEERDSGEVKKIQGKCGDEIKTVLLTPEDSPAVNYGFDVTPARLVSGLITERGVCEADERSILGLFPEHR
ncbi:S-methyl-5-thioribose-1-phosphate isomerase [candidate division FCPU426 bacterium]|nr:S-methyl-5-thioribose-1-phosphate isomerase [candidate division FCPU426 bacterium]